MRGMVVGEGGRSSGVLLYTHFKITCQTQPHDAFTVDVMSKKMISKLLTRYNIVLSICACAGSHIGACVRTHIHMHVRTYTHARARVLTFLGKPFAMLKSKSWVMHVR